MKKNKHPKYQKVLFIDSSTGDKIVIGSSLDTKETEEFEGVEYPVYRASITSRSSPFFSGESGMVDTEGRVDKYRKRYKKN